MQGLAEGYGLSFTHYIMPGGQSMGQKLKSKENVNSHNQYSVTRDKKHNILCVVSEVVGTGFLFLTGYAVFSVGAILDLIVAGGAQ